jgi:hypothetical protein
MPPRAASSYMSRMHWRAVSVYDGGTAGECPSSWYYNEIGPFIIGRIAQVARAYGE